MAFLTGCIVVKLSVDDRNVFTNDWKFVYFSISRPFKGYLLEKCWKLLSASLKPLYNNGAFIGSSFHFWQINRKNYLERSIGQYFELAASNQRVKERYRDAVLDIPAHETVLRPRETLQRLCDHLGVTCSEDYFEKCSKVMYGRPSVTRDKVVWSDEQIKRVTEMMKSYPFLKDYSFDKYPS